VRFSFASGSRRRRRRNSRNSCTSGGRRSAAVSAVSRVRGACRRRALFFVCRGLGVGAARGLRGQLLQKPAEPNVHVLAEGPVPAPRLFVGAAHLLFFKKKGNNSIREKAIKKCGSASRRAIPTQRRALHGVATLGSWYNFLPPPRV
jgi:hypothetical protein